MVLDGEVDGLEHITHEPRHYHSIAEALYTFAAMVGEKLGHAKGCFDHERSKAQQVPIVGDGKDRSKNSEDGDGSCHAGQEPNLIREKVL